MNTLQYTDDTLQNYTRKTRMTLLTNVIPVNLINLNFLTEIQIPSD